MSDQNVVDVGLLDEELDGLLQALAEKTGKDPMDVGGEVIRDTLRKMELLQGLNEGQILSFPGGPGKGLKRN
ncbi:hypothetical protein [Azotobacter salinestris]|uniref:hypothetical protein n=1 Tax=Azotobacter salinestris TaxID=69964 RepID=UPI0032DF4D40